MSAYIIQTPGNYPKENIMSPDDGHMVAWNMYRIEINIHEKFVRQFGLFIKIILECMVNKA